MFMSPLCESCQRVVEPLNAIAEDAARGVRAVVIMRADEHAARAFNSVFPLRMPLICDEYRTITMGFGVHAAPYGLLYDGRGTLVRKGVVTDWAQLQAVLGDTAVPVVGQTTASPNATSSGMLA
jgi:hypothetical protein